MSDENKSSFKDWLKVIKKLFSCLSHGEHAMDSVEKLQNQAQQQSQGQVPQQQQTVRLSPPASRAVNSNRNLSRTRTDLDDEPHASHDHRLTQIIAPVRSPTRCRRWLEEFWITFSMDADLYPRIDGLLPETAFRLA
jgi:hypothetical protein